MTNGTTVHTTDYLDGFQYYNSNLEFFAHAEGYVKQTTLQGQMTFDYIYNYTDHLGNVRVSYTKDPQTGDLKILEENHYYPFGLKHSVYADNKNKIEAINNNTQKAVNPDNPVDVNSIYARYDYKFGAKEWQDELGLNVYDFGARIYDPTAPHFWQIDPLAEEYSNWSPYAYVMNNPLRYSDPTGMKGDDFIDIDKKTGGIKITKAEGNDQVRLVDDGKVVDSYEYGENGSFVEENQVTHTEGNVRDSETVIEFGDYNKAETFFKFAAKSDVEFAFIDFVFTPKGGNISGFSAVLTNHRKTTVDPRPYASKILDSNPDAKVGTYSHSHPGKFNFFTIWPAYPSGYDKDLKPTNSNRGDRPHHIMMKEKYGSRMPDYSEVYAPSAPGIKVKYNGNEVIRTTE